MKKSLILSFCLILLSGILHAADSTRVVKASLQSLSQLYVDDPLTGQKAKPFASNDYLKFDYYYGRFSAGVQGEAYLPGILGYPANLTGVSLSNAYAAWTAAGYSFTAGTLYEQFGSGLLFRSWEDRSIGINNALLGARGTFSYKDAVAFKALAGTPRYGIRYNTGTRLAGADISLSPTAFLKGLPFHMALEASWLGVFYRGEEKPQNGWSGRMNLSAGAFSGKLEYVSPGNREGGNAQLAQFAFNSGSLGINLDLRRLEWMNTQIVKGEVMDNNLFNYLPALCTQYTYELANMHPYHAMAGEMMTDGEMGGQADLFYHFKRGSALGGKRGMKLHLNFASYFRLSGESGFEPGRMLMRDACAEVEKAFSRRFKLNFLYSFQEFSPTYGNTKATSLAHIAVADMQYKFTDALSLRSEIQYLYTQENFSSDHNEDGDWVAGLLELGFAPHWSVYVSDMCNIGSSFNNYYNAGVSFTWEKLMASLSWGRYKAGYLCSGGICRIVPAYSGAAISINYSF